MNQTNAGTNQTQQSKFNQDKEDLGSEAADLWYKKTAEKALKEMGCKRTIPILKLDSDRNPGLNGLTTTSGIWLRHYDVFYEPMMNNKIFTAYHEAAHGALEHPRKGHNFGLLFGISSQLTCSFIGYHLANQIYKCSGLDNILQNQVASQQCRKLIQNSISATLGLWAGGHMCKPINKLVFCAYMRNMEKEADSLAAETLCKIGDRQVVNDIADRLTDDPIISWPWFFNLLRTHPTEQETLENLREILKKYK